MTERPYNPASDLAVDLRAMLATAKFVRQPARSGGEEEVYEFDASKVAPRAFIKVFSSIVGDKVRPDGEDAIRVAMMYRCLDGKVVDLVNVKRVNRTGTVEGINNRTLGRMRAVYRELQKRIFDKKVCPRCQAPLRESKRGNAVCAEACWATKFASAPSRAKPVAPPAPAREYGDSAGHMEMERQMRDEEDHWDRGFDDNNDRNF